jgi:hypothetical protein
MPNTHNSLNRLDLANKALWLDQNNKVHDITKLPTGYLLNILKFCNPKLRFYIHEELDYRLNPTEPWIKAMLREN